MNWGKMLKFAGISMGVCLALVLGGIVAYSRIFEEPEVTVTRPAFAMRPDSVIGGANNNSEGWDVDFSEALGFLPEFADEYYEYYDWDRKEGFWTFLLFALDEYNNSDVMWVVSYCTQEHEVNIIDIPRDVRVDIAPRDVQRINAAFAIGRRGGDDEDGIRQLKEEVAWLIGFEVDFFISVTMRGFARLIDDVLGGVTVNVPLRMEYYSPGQNLHINLQPGRQRLTGTQAVHFARWRQNTNHTGNIGTARRGEHIFMLAEALAREAWSAMPGLLLRAPDIIAIYDRYVRTDLSITNMLYFAQHFLSNDVQMHYHRIPVTSVTRPRWYDVPIYDQTLELINATVNPFTSDIERIMFRGDEEDE